jgi:N-carbamoylputrescine amidase
VLPGTRTEAALNTRVGGVQSASRPGDIGHNVGAIVSAARAAKAEHPDLALLAFPELATTGYSCGAVFHDLAVTWPHGGYLPELGAVARELELVLVVGYAERLGPHGLTADSAAVIDADGRMVASYRKTHCLDRERHHFVNGSRLPVLPTAAGRLGVLICWDAAMPEAARSYAVGGADLLVVIGAWEDPYVGDWSLVVSARAYDNVIPVLAVNRTGREEGAAFSGGSRLVDCLGKEVASAGVEPGALLTGHVDFAFTASTRAGYGSQLRDRRPDLYGAVVAPIDEPLPAVGGAPSAGADARPGTKEC